MWMKKIACEIGVLVALSRMSLFFQGRNERDIRVPLISSFHSISHWKGRRLTRLDVREVMDKGWKMVEKIK